MEDTQIRTKEEQEEKDILSAMQLGVGKAPEAGETKVGQDVSGDIGEGDTKINIPAVVSSIVSAGYSYLYNTRTGDKSRFNNNMLPRVVRQRWNDEPLKGQLVWSARPVTSPPHPIKVGTFKCMLHKDAPNRELYDQMGFAICPKDNLASPYQVRRHMMKKHKDEWAAIEDMRKEAEKKKSDERADSQLRAMEALARRETPPLYVSKKDREE